MGLEYGCGADWPSFRFLDLDFGMVFGGGGDAEFLRRLLVEYMSVQWLCGLWSGMILSLDCQVG